MDGVACRPADRRLSGAAASADGWADAVLAFSQRHRFRGVTAEMFMGCLKTLFHSVEELLHEMGAPAGRTLAALDILRCYADAMDTLLVGHWAKLSQQEAIAKLDASNRQLTLQKNKFENIFTTTSDLVLVADVDGHIEEANQAARAFLDKAALQSMAVWDLLGLGGASMATCCPFTPPASRTRSASMAALPIWRCGSHRCRRCPWPRRPICSS